MSNYLVTGGYGFIGSNWILQNINPIDNFIVVDNLSIGSNVDNLKEVKHLKNLHFINCDICDLTLKHIEDINVIPNYIVHFAAESHVDRSITNPLGFVKTNVLGTTNMLNVALQIKNKHQVPVRFLHVSTDEVFGHLEAHDKPFDESTPYAPRSPYSASKAASDHLARAFHHTYGLDVVKTHCCNNMGNNQYEEKLIPKIIRNCFHGIIIPIYGNGNNLREWIPVDKHNEAITLVLKNGKSGETYCIGSGIEKTNIEIVYFICKYIDEHYDLPHKCADLIRFVEDRKGHDFRYAVNSTKIKTELGWECNINFEKELESIVNQSFINTYRNFGAIQHEIQLRHNNSKMQ